MPVSKALKVAAQGIMDLFYQDFKPDDAFFDLDDFAAWIGKVYGTIADSVAKEIYDASRSEGIPMIIFSQDWWAKREDVAIKDGVADISDIKYTGFTYDTQNSGIQQVGDGIKFIRTTLTELWQLEGIKVKSDLVFWYSDFDKLRFKATCSIPDKADIYYIPTAEDEKFKLPKSKEFEIATQAWNLMIAGKQGTPFVDKTNNSNQNVTPQSEIDTNQSQPATKQ